MVEAATDAEGLGQRDGAPGVVTWCTVAQENAPLVDAAGDLSTR